MEILTGLVYLSILVLVRAEGDADKEKDEVVHYKPCPEGWTQKQGRCYKLLDKSYRFRDAYTQCDGHLPVILNAEDQKNVRDIVSDSVWMGIYRQSETEWVWMSALYNNATYDKKQFSVWQNDAYKSDIRDKCALINRYGSWAPEYCESARDTLCVKPAGCDEGWFGVNCSYACHCYNSECENPFLQECTDGCQTGWKGKLCNIPQSQSSVSVSYYCFKSESNYSMFLLLDQRDYNFNSITVVDSEGRTSPDCSRDSFQEQWQDHKLYINIVTDASSHYQPPCPAMKVEEGPKLKWQFRLQKSAGVTSVYDEDIFITCDYTSASELRVNNDQIKTNEIKLTTLERKRLSAEIYPASYQNLTRLDPSNMGAGQTLVLVAATTVATGDNIRGLYPVLCQANSPDGKAVKKLTDENGCGVSDLGFDRFHLRETEQGPVFVSGRFLAFTFPGYSTVQFTCDFRPGVTERCHS